MPPLLSVLLMSPDQLPAEVSTLWTTILYVGPDQILPLTSALGAIAGFLMIFWQRVVGLARKVWQLFGRR